MANNLCQRDWNRTSDLNIPNVAHYQAVLRADRFCLDLNTFDTAYCGCMYLTNMNKRSVVNLLIERRKDIDFREWAVIRNTVSPKFKSQINSILNALSGGTVEFAAYKLSEDVVICATPKVNINIMIYETDDVGKFDFFGIQNNKVVDRSDIQFAFAELTNV